MRVTLPTILLSAALLSAAPLPAQVLDGILVDPKAGGPVTRATVVLLDSAGQAVATVQTRGDGRFLLRAPAGGTYGVRAEREGALLATGTVILAQGITTQVEMRAAEGAVAAAATGERAIALEPLEAVGAARRRFLDNVGYYDRQAVNTGVFLTGDQFRARGGARVVDALQGLRGTFARPNPQNNARSSMGWLIYQHRFGGRCQVLLYIDGIQREADALHTVQARDVEAVEVYSASEVPARFSPQQGANKCGAIVIWMSRAAG
ncbi:MAG TPA: carboxypeptidase-like regulatory domain-containing protein [Longimicrobium sp.]|nr:carboxypeptidase-like regulatory domain-containing protein [Longimicrobium sp.]